MWLFSRPCGTLLLGSIPGIEMPGYCRVSLRDKGCGLDGGVEGIKVQKYVKSHGIELNQT